MSLAPHSIYVSGLGEGSSAIVIASLVPVAATVAGLGNVTVDSEYPFEDAARLTVDAAQALELKVRIPAWAVTEDTAAGAPLRVA